MRELQEELQNSWETGSGTRRGKVRRGWERIDEEKKGRVKTES